MKQIFIMVFLITGLSANYYAEAGEKFGIDPQLFGRLPIKKVGLIQALLARKTKMEAMT